MAAGKGEAEIVQARTDKREYRRIVLKNSLEALLISDPDTDKCAATMDVGVGSFSDPEGLEGLAHFLEHMLFYASEKYPLEDSYSKYIIEHGGRTNAFTASEHTNYHFDVNTDCFEEALDRFAQFFIKPLMSADATMREIKAVDSENQKNLLSDAWRMNQLQKHLSMEGHPYHKFSTGSLDTLEVRPKARGLDTRLELLKFYKENYSANLMHLVVYAKENLDKIENMVEQKFQDIQNANRSCFRCPGPPCTPEHLQILVRAVPIKEGHKLRIVWPITPEILHYKEGPCRYLGHLIGHEGEGSLFYILKTLGWATGLSAGETDWTLDFSFFKVIIDLTEAGHEHMQDVIGLLFKYICLLQQSGICKWIFDELSAICETKFHYQDKTPPADYVVNIASNMQIYPPHDWLVGSSLPSMFNPGTIERVLEELSIDNVRIFWESKKFEESSRSRLWYKPDTKFSTPKAYVKMDFNCPHAGNSPEAEVLTDLFTRLLMDYLNEYAYYAQVAGLYYGINQTDCGFQVTLVGYNHKLRALLDTVLAKIAKFKVKADRFSVIKEMVTKEYQNFKFQQPYQQAMYYCSLILQDHTWPWMEELEVLPHLEAEDLAKFAPVMLSRAFLECYIAGNIESSEAESMVQHVEDVFFSGSKPICQPLFPSQHVTNRVVKLERGMSYFYSAEGLNPNDDNSALVHYIQVHRDDFLLNVKLQLFALIAKQPAFHQLRSVEQLGYITVLMKRNDSGIHGVQFIIQSTVKGPGNIDLRVEAFLKTFESKIYEMTDDEFKNNVNALIDMKLEKYKNLREESGFYWREIYYGTLKFDRKESEVAALRKLTQQELIDFFNDYIKVGATQRKSLSVGVYGNLHNSEYKADHASEPGPYSVKIDNIFSFRRSQALYGSFRGVTGHVKL
ncbi:hypothetical protein I3843_09G037900 [Carya illinoinensis]|uniref:Insulin-degrading enzyme-like 1, peroxisomal n=1 Tax=Carya illinoinensis TaxID=32201 RepID=A0A922E2Q2_CARIL|nr:hypothetical protein I3760_09G037100 [Carya illinoinensis]KAG6694203.1 hypothetical protein I3842_09G037400 [Carya illinoinensis]KAG7961871.1 hypothetical protein I3843_09G037900 [Carya illinoinensis]